MNLNTTADNSKGIGKKVFLTGASGLLGQYLAAELLAKGYSVNALKRKETDVSALPEAIGTRLQWLEGSLFDLPWLENTLTDVDYIVHAAGKVSFQPRDRRALYKTNVEGTANLVNVALHLQKKPGGRPLQKLVHISSVAALGRERDKTVIDEESRGEDSNVQSVYGKTKYLGELEVWRAANEGLPVVIVNPSVILGVGPVTRSSTTLFGYAQKGGKFYTHGLLNYVDARDVACASLQLMESNILSERFVLSAGTVPYKTFFDMAAERFGQKGPSVQVGNGLSGLAWRWEWIKSVFTGKAPLVTRETAQSAQNKLIYKNDKLVKALEFRFKGLEETLDWVCAEV